MRPGSHQKFHAGTFQPAVPGSDGKREKAMPDKPVEGKEMEIPINDLDAKLLESLRNPEKSLEPLGPLAGNPNGWLSEEET